MAGDKCCPALVWEGAPARNHPQVIHPSLAWNFARIGLPIKRMDACDGHRLPSGQVKTLLKKVLSR